MSEYEPRVNGGTIRSGRYTNYRVIVVGIVEEQMQQNVFRLKTSDEVSIVIRVPTEMASALMPQGSSVLEAFEIVGLVESDCSLTVSNIVPLFDSTNGAKDFDMKLYDKLVGYWNSSSFQDLFFPSRAE